MTQIIDLLVSYLKNNPNKNIRTIAKDLSISQSLVSQTLYEYTNVFELNKNTNLWIFIFKFDTDNLSYVDDNILGEVCLFDYTDQYLNYIEETNEISLNIFAPSIDKSNDAEFLVDLISELFILAMNS